RRDQRAEHRENTTGEQQQPADPGWMRLPWTASPSPADHIDRRQGRRQQQRAGLQRPRGPRTHAWIVPNRQTSGCRLRWANAQSILPQLGGRSMRIEVKGRNLPVSEDLREHVEKRFRKVARQVSEFAELEVEVFEERNPAIADSQVAEATLHLKGVTLRARD